MQQTTKTGTLSYPHTPPPPALSPGTSSTLRLARAKTALHVPQANVQVTPLAAAGGAEAAAENAQGPPNLLWRVAAAMMYLIPWIDTIHIGREIYHRFPITVMIDVLPGAHSKALLLQGNVNTSLVIDKQGEAHGHTCFEPFYAIHW